MIRRGAIWSGIDLTPASVERVRQRLEIRGLRYEKVQCASALSIPYPDGYFDIVFSHGVLHHIPEIKDAQREIARVLRPGGRLIMMVYAKRSLNYLLAISIVRRLGLALCYFSGIVPPGKIGEHVRNARRTGLLEYMKMKNFLGRNTDGPGNPYSKVYSISDVKADFPDFRVVTHGQEWMHAPPLPVGWLKPLGGVLGWHLWVELVPTASSGRSPVTGSSREAQSRDDSVRRTPERFTAVSRSCAGLPARCGFAVLREGSPDSSAAPCSRGPSSPPQSMAASRLRACKPGALRVEGNRTLAEGFVTLFPLPPKVAGPG